MARGHAQKAALHAKQSVTIGFAGDLAATLQRYADYVKEEALRSAAYAAAKVFYLEMRIRTASSKTGKGVLHEAIYHWHDPKQSTPDRQVYAIGPNKKKASHWAFVEFGHWRYFKTVLLDDGTWITLRNEPLATPKWIPGKSYIRATWDAKAPEAMAAAKARLAEKLKEFDGSL